MRSSAFRESPLLSAPCSPGMSLKTISAYVVFFGLKIVLKASIRSSGTLTAPRCTSPPNPVGTLSPVNVLNTVVLPEPANPTRPTFIEDLPVRRFLSPRSQWWYNRVIPGHQGYALEADVSNAHRAAP